MKKQLFWFKFFCLIGITMSDSQISNATCLTPESESIIEMTDDDEKRLIEEHKKKNGALELSLSLQTKYVWRGMEMQVSEAAPTLFPSINYSRNGIAAYVMGGYSINGKYGEVDLGVSYTKKWFTIGVADYYYPTLNSSQDQYFNFKSHSTGHWFEGYMMACPENVPLTLTVSIFFAGADKTFEGKQAYSTYAEVGTWYDLSDNNQISLNVGAAFNKSCYNGYKHGFGICNIEAKYSHALNLKNDLTMPLSVSYTVNPVFEKSFVNFSASISF